jgi:hypothetical protein
MAALRQLVARVGAGHVGIEVRRVISQQVPADQVPVFGRPPVGAIEPVLSGSGPKALPQAGRPDQQI